MSEDPRSDSSSEDPVDDEGMAPTLDLGGEADDPSAPVSGAGPDYPGLVEVNSAHYRLEEELAEGGQGRIRLGRDRRLGRRVAIKELKHRSPEQERRFEREARITAGLQHPGIVTIYEAGRWQDGRPFYAMKVVEGRSLQEVVRGVGSLDQRLPLLPVILRVAEAMAYAHSRGIIHRDLKPANVVVGAFGEAVVIDWGLAKDLNAPEEEGPPAGTTSPPPTSGSDSAGLTADGAVLGTPAYMPPEQARGELVDRRADVYSLGAMLYHVLAGRPPYAARSADTLIRKVLAGPPEPLTGHVSGVPPDLLAVVEKAMARDPASRYRDAGEVAEELERFQTGRLVSAHRYTAGQRAGRLLRRHRGAVGVAIVAALVLLSYGGWSVRRILAERDAAMTARDQATAAEAQAVSRADALVLAQARSSLQEDPNQSLDWLRQLSSGAEEWGAARVIASDARARGIAQVLRGHEGWVNDVVWIDGGHRLVSAGNDGTLRVWRSDGEPERVLEGHEGPVNVLAVAPGGERFYSGGAEGAVLGWPREGALPISLGRHRGPVLDLDVSPDGSHIASAGGDGRVGLGSTIDDRGWLLLEGHREPVQAVSFGPRGERLASGAADGTARLWDGGTGEPLRELTGHRDWVTDVAFSPDGARLATTSEDATIRIWDLKGGASEVLEAHTKAVMKARFLPSGELVTGADDGLVIRWRDGEATVLGQHGSYISDLELYPDLDLVAASSFDHTVGIWDLGLQTQSDSAETGSRLLSGHSAHVMNLSLSPDGTRVASASRDGEVRIWPIAATDRRRLATNDGIALKRVQFSPDGSRLVWAGDEGVLGTVDLATGAVRSLDLGGAWVIDLAFQGGEPVTIDNSGALLRWRPSGSPETLLDLSSALTAAALTQGGHVLAAVDSDGELHHWRNGMVLSRDREGAPVTLLALSPDGARVAIMDRDRAIEIWDSDAETVEPLPSPPVPLHYLTFSPDGEFLAGCSVDSVDVYLWRDGELERLRGHDNWVTHLAFSPDGRRLASGSFDATVRLWELGSGESSVLRGHQHWVQYVAFAEDGTKLVSGSSDETARLWDLGSGEGRALVGHRGELTAAAFSPDGSRIATVAKDGAVWLYDDDLPVVPAELRSWIDGALGGAPP